MFTKTMLQMQSRFANNKHIVSLRLNWIVSLNCFINASTIKKMIEALQMRI